MKGEMHVIPSSELERIKRIEYERGVRDGWAQRAGAERLTRTKPFGRRKPKDAQPMRGT